MWWLRHSGHAGWTVLVVTLEYVRLRVKRPDVYTLRLSSADWARYDGLATI